MDDIANVYRLMLVLSTAYAALWGGRTGIAGAAIFLAASITSTWSTALNPSWQGTAFAMMLVDGVCMFALLALALFSSRYWPIWALGLQAVTLVTHLATIIDSRIVPLIYSAMAGFWSIPIMLIMVWGTMLDRAEMRKGSTQA
jgi:hypothetical protein